MSAERIEKLLEDIRFLDPARFELVQSLRELILGLGARGGCEALIRGWCAASGLRPGVVFAVAPGLSVALLSVVYVADRAVPGTTTSSALAGLF
ncbi:MAG: hypothetical protein FD187_522 [bacterium]|nr:MAG: hypothetical protein FD142_444 [bacterium]KAF0150287.1 MAG: hypothetical protein FD187_522 [bacterium]KAF0169767.1 MAG: hypothetical protein FD158_154 [bacterium]TXT20587.1 MAG: hypothetical protein FD132_1155 [bacterium]